MKQYRIVLNVAHFYTPSHSTCPCFCVPSPFRVGVSSLLSFLFSFFALTTTSQAQIITTIAGNGIQGYSGDNGLAIHAEFGQSFGLIADRFGNIYLADNQFYRIRKIDTAGYITTFAGSGMANPFNGDGIMATDANILATDVAVDDSGNVFLPDSHFKIRKINPVTGIITTVVGTGISGFGGDNGPASVAQIGAISGISIDKAGNMYLPDYFYAKVRKVNPAGIITTIAGNGSFGFSGDNGPATNAMLNLGSMVRASADDIGNVYIPDRINGRIRKIDTFGTISTIAGTGVSGYNGDGIPATMAQIFLATSIYKDRLGNIFFNDYYRIRKINPTGIISTYAGTGIMGYSGDHGPATTAQLNEPSSICMDTAGNMLLLDDGNSRIRKIAFSLLCTNITNTKFSCFLQPNPCNGIINLIINQPTSANITITITNTIGALIQTYNVPANKQTTLYINAPPGIYYLMANTIYGNIIKKIIIN